MKKLLSSFLVLLFALNALNALNAMAVGRIQNSDVKSEADLVAAGATKTSLINDSKIYMTANGINDRLDNAVTNGLIGGGGGGGGKNYLSDGVFASTNPTVANPGNGGFEKGSISGWFKGHTALSATLAPTTVVSAGTDYSAGTSAASANLTLSAVQTNVLEKKYSANLASSAASVAGDMLMSSAFYIDAADKNTTLSFNFSYNVQTVGGLAFTGGYNTNAFALWVYDATNGVWIAANNAYCMTGISAVSQNCAASFPASNGSKYQIAVINQIASTSAYSLNFDSFSVGPQLKNSVVIRQVGSIITTGSLTPPTGYLYADGSAISRVQYADLFAVIGTTYGTGDGSSTFNIPDLRAAFLRGAGTSTKFTQNHTTALGAAESDQMQGHDHTGYAGGSFIGGGYGTVGANVNVTGAAFNIAATTGTPVTDGTNGTPRTGNETRPNNVGVAYHICYSAGNVVMSDQTSQGDAIARIGIGATQTVASATEAKLAGTVSVYADTASMADTSNSRINIKTAGWYTMRGAMLWAPDSFGGETHLFFKVSGTTVSNRSITGKGNNTLSTYSGNIHPGVTIKLNAGDYVEMWVYNGATGTRTMQSDSSLTWFEVVRTTPSLSVASTEGLSVSYTGVPSVVSGSLSAGTAVLSYPNLDFGNQGTYASGVWTAPVSGTYRVSAQTVWNSASTSGYSAMTLMNTVTAQKKRFTLIFIAPWSNGPVLNASATIKLKAGEGVTVLGETSIASPSFLGDNTSSFLQIDRIGNY